MSARIVTNPYMQQWLKPYGNAEGLLNRIESDQKTVAERKWRDGLKPDKPQQPCDIGLFSDDALQLDLVEMLMEPTNE